MFWSFVHRIRVTLISAVIGGIAGGAGLAFAEAFSRASSPLLVPFVAIFTAFIFGTFGASLGGVVGLLPTTVLGALLSTLRKIPPFDHWLAWMLSGAIGGFCMGLLTNHWFGIGTGAHPTGSDPQLSWRCAWVAGGIAAMFAYWRIETNWGARRQA